MALVKLVEHADAAPEVRAVHDEIVRARGADWINNFWKALANATNRLANGLRIPADECFR